MKRFLIIAILVILSVAAGAQSPMRGFLKPVDKVLVAPDGTLDRAFLEGSDLLLRLDVGLASPALMFDLNEAGDIIGVKSAPFMKEAAGIFLKHYKLDLTQDWGVGLMLTLPPPAGGRYGAAIAGSYSIFKVGVNYDFGLPLKQGISILTGITIDIFNNVD